MNELALFAGAGGGLLASKLLGWRTLCAVEIADYPRRVLLARQNEGALEPFPIWDDICTFNGKPLRGLAEVVSGGFPCQDISIARAMWGRDGINGTKSGLWYQYLRIIDEVELRIVWGENSPELRRKGLDRIVRALAMRGYICRWATLGADDLGLPHIRKRLWFLATKPDGQGRERHARNVYDQGGRPDSTGSLADAGVFVCSFCGHQMETDDRYGCANCLGQGLECDDPWSELQPRIAGMADGVADRVERIRAIGNGQVPAVAVSAWRLLTAQ